MIKTVFYILSILVILAAVFFAFDNNAKMKDQMAKWKETNGTNTNVAASIKERGKELEVAKNELGAAKTRNAELISTKENEQSKERNLKQTLDQYNVDIEDTDAEVIKFEEIKKKVEGMIGGLNIPFDQIPGEIQKMEDQRKAQASKLEELVMLEEKLDKNVAENNDENARLASRLGEIRSKISRNAVQGAVIAVDSNWGFVIVNKGRSNSNITEQSDLLVSRGGRLLGRLKVHSLEVNQTICDLDLKSLKPGVRIQPGDRVTVSEAAAN